MLAAPKVPCMRFEVLTMLDLKIIIFWSVRPYVLHYGGTCCPIFIVEDSCSRFVKDIGALCATKVFTRNFL